jgi:hypothetical protein
MRKNQLKKLNCNFKIKSKLLFLKIIMILKMKMKSIKFKTKKMIKITKNIILNKLIK